MIECFPELNATTEVESVARITKEEMTKLVHIDENEDRSKLHSLHTVETVTTVWQSAVQNVLTTPAPRRGPDLLAMRTRWMAGTAPHKSGRCRD